MQQVRGERFFIPLDEVEAAEAIERKATGALSGTLVSDVLERPSGAAPPPAPPKVKSTATGFPEHRKRTRQSVFKQRQSEASTDVPTQQHATVSSKSPPVTDRESFERADRLRIDQENKDKLRNMSPEEIEREREELFSGLSPALIQRLLKRSTIEDRQPPAGAEVNGTAKTPSGKKVAFAEPNDQQTTASFGPRPGEDISGADGAEIKDEDKPIKIDEAGPPQPVDATIMLSSQLRSTHFPQPPEPPDLDPRSESFLSDLHEKYFPNLSHDPNKLSWMQPTSSDDTRSPYHPAQLSLPPEALRFNFKGQLLPPNLARQIPVSEGLHHHGDAPEAAGYTIPELAHLARSSNASQRCIAFQTSGRILYRLGIGEFGKEDDKVEEIAALSRGLWDTIEGSKVIQIMTVEAGKERGHLSARAYAQEALWNWRRGGGRTRKAT